MMRLPLQVVSDIEKSASGKDTVVLAMGRFRNPLADMY